MPEYARFAHSAAERAKDGVSRDDIVWLVDGMKKHYRAIVDRGVADAAELLATMSNEQLRALPRQWSKDNHRFVDDHDLDGSAEQQKRARLNRTLTQIGEWTGSLSRMQEQRIEQLLAGHGYKHYETSAFAQAGARCRHNLNYWLFGDYIGIGAGAHGKLSFPDRVVREVRFRQPKQ